MKLEMHCNNVTSRRMRYHVITYCFVHYMYVITHTNNVISMLYLCNDRHIVFFLMIYIDNNETGRNKENKIVLLWDRIYYYYYYYIYIYEGHPKITNQCLIAIKIGFKYNLLVHSPSK